MKDLTSGVVVIVLGVAIFLMARGMKSPVPGFGPEVFPSAIGILLAIFGGILTYQGLGLVKSRKSIEEKSVGIRHLWIIFFILILTTGYIVSLLSIPFLVATPIYLFILILTGKAVKEGRIGRKFQPKTIMFTAMVTVMIYVLFKLIFRVALI
jgi:hypothetical protein